tara:strand:+ start:695 stop:1012 length:318 start_codon:yes stop_codon:yes gene_type:complete
MIEDFDDIEWEMEFNGNSGLKGVIDDLADNAGEFSVTLCTKVCDAIDNGKSSVVIAYVAGDYDLEVVATEDKYLEVLELNLERVEQEEEYELCIRVREKMKELKN